MADEHLISLQPGTVIAGRYEVVRCLGAGSMGLVYACRHRELTGHLVAIKVLFPEVAQDKIASARFRNEIFASYGVSHPNVVRAYEYLRDGDLVAYTMEYVAGGALSDKLDNVEEPLPIEEIVQIWGQMCLGVQAIHDAGIVHRDLKPENILLTKEGDVKIADFGIARTGNGPRLTEHGGVVGTIDYVSPEYMLNSQVDWRSDIYAMGILAYEMITGESPFRGGDSVYATMTKRLKTDPKPPSSLRPECPRKLDEIVLRAMARDPEARYQSAIEIFTDLQSLMPDALSPISAAHQMGVKKRPAGYVGPILQVGNAASSSDEHDEVVADDEVTSTTEIDPDLTYDHGSSYGKAEPKPSEVLWSPEGESSHEPPVTATQAPQVEGIAEDNEPVVAPAARVPTFEAKPEDSWIGDMDKLKRLTKAQEESLPSLWADIIILIVAAVIGIGVGVVFLNIFFPDLLSRGFSFVKG